MSNINVNGVTSSDLTVSGADTITVSNGGTTINTTASSGGTEFVSGTGLESAGKYVDGGRLVLSNGGSALDTNIGSDGIIELWSNTTFTNVTVASGGIVDVN